MLPALTLPGGVNIGRLDLSIDWRVCAAAIAATVLTFGLGNGPASRQSHASSPRK